MPTIPGTIAATISDVELSALVAEHVAELITPCTPENGDWRAWRDAHGHYYGITEDGHGESRDTGFRSPSFATDANAVLALAEKTGLLVEIYFDPRGKSWVVELSGQHNSRKHFRVDLEQTLSRSACFCLLKAKGWNVVEASA